MRRAEASRRPAPVRLWLAALAALAALAGCATRPDYLPYALLGDPVAQRRMAAACERRGAPREALAFHVKAAEAGEVGAMLRAAELCSAGEVRDTACASRWARAILARRAPGDAEAFEPALAMVRRLAEAGDPPSQRALAELYGAGRGVEANQALAAAWLTRAAEQGDAQAQLALARRYFYADEAVVVRLPGGGAPVVRDYRTVGQEESGLAHDNARAALWARRAAEQGLGEAQLFLARAHAQGQGVAQSAEEAERWFLLAAAHGQEEALFLLARMYDDGAQALRDPARAVRFYRQAAESGHRGAQVRLAEIYFFGQGVARDRQAAGRWAMAAAGLARGDAQLQSFLAQGVDRGFPRLPGVPHAPSAGPAGPGAAVRRPDPDWDPVLLTGEGLPRFPASAKGEWLASAARRGEVMAQVHLFLAHLTAGARLPLKPGEFASLVRRGAEAGSAASERLLAALHCVGLGVDESDQQAAAWLERAAAASGDPADALILASMHLRGIAGRAGDGQAASWARRAADMGSGAAHRAVAALYLAGIGVQADAAQAVEWMRAGARAEDGEAQRILASMYRRGLSPLAQSDAQAAHWLRRSASLTAGHAAASRAASQVALAGLYCEGKGVVQSQQMAAAWLDTAQRGMPGPAAAGTGAPAQAADLLFQQILRRLEANGDAASRRLLAPMEVQPWLQRAATQGFLPAQLFLAARAVDRQEALRWYLVAANQGSLAAQLALKELFDFRFILQWTRDAAGQGHLASQIELAEKHRFGDGVERDLAEAEKWYRRAAEQDLETQVALADMYFHGKGRLRGEQGCPEVDGPAEAAACPWPRDEEKATALYRRAAERGHRRAQLTMARLCERTAGADKGFERAAKWYRLAAEQGDLGAQLRLAKAYERGVEIERKPEQVLKWYLKAAEQGDREAQIQVAQMYEQGSGTPQNPAEAGRWYLRAALNGGAPAIALIQKAAELGHADGQYWLARAYAEGRDTARDIEVSVQYLRRAAAQDHPEALRLLAQALDAGEGLAQDRAEAARLYLGLLDRVADPVPLRLRLAEMHARGEGVPQDEGEALKWYLSAAQSSPEAQIQIANRYRLGIGTEKRPEEAAQWYLQVLERHSMAGGADQASPCSQSLSRWEVIAAVRLAEMYGAGEGVPQGAAPFLHWIQLVLCSGGGVLFGEWEALAAPLLDLLARRPPPAGLGSVDALLLLARAHQGAAEFFADGAERTMAMDRALSAYRQAADAGSALAHFALSGLYREPEGRAAPPRDLGAALRACEVGLQLGDGIASQLSRELFKPFDTCAPAEIYYELGRAGLGHRSRKRVREALAWLDRAAQQGHRQAALALIDAYGGGRGMRRDQREALKWVQRLAEAGDLHMRLRLARMYERGGNGVARNPREAFRWYRAASEGGDPGALRALARAHELGIGVERDPRAAAQLYARAFMKYDELHRFSPWLLVEMADMAWQGQGIESRDISLASQYLDALLKNEQIDLAARPEHLARIRGMLRRFAAMGDVKARQNLKIISDKSSVRPLRAHPPDASRQP